MKYKTLIENRSIEELVEALFDYQIDDISEHILLEEEPSLATASIIELDKRLNGGRCLEALKEEFDRELSFREAEEKYFIRGK